MIIGFGNDLCDIRRIEDFARTLRRAFRRGAASPRRSGANPMARAGRAASYAKRFAAKEACAKALGTGLRARRALARHGRRQSASGKPTIEPDRRRGGAARSPHAAWPPSLYPSDVDRRISLGSGASDHRSGRNRGWRRMNTSSARALAKRSFSRVTRLRHRLVSSPAVVLKS